MYTVVVGQVEFLTIIHLARYNNYYTALYCVIKLLNARSLPQHCLFELQNYAPRCYLNTLLFVKENLFLRRFYLICERNKFCNKFCKNLSRWSKSVVSKRWPIGAKWPAEPQTMACERFNHGPNLFHDVFFPSTLDIYNFLETLNNVFRRKMAREDLRCVRLWPATLLVNFLAHGPQCLRTIDQQFYIIKLCCQLFEYSTSLTFQ